MHFKVKHKVWKQVLGLWIRIPCIGKGCEPTMPCEMFQMFGYNGTCPIQPGNYRDYELTIPVPYFPVPFFLTDGNYAFHIEGYNADNMDEMWFCGDMTQYFEQVKSA